MPILRVLLEHGGVAMVLIAAGSVVSVALALERFLYFAGFRRRAGALHAALLPLAREGRLDEAARIARDTKSPASPAYLAAIERVQAGRDPAGPAERARRRAVAQLKAGLWAQGTLGATMPFVGLFGTVVGVLESFGMIAQSGTSGFAVVSGAISEALITTAGGIAVAVEAVVLYNVCSAMATSRGLDLSLQLEEFVEALREQDRAPARESA